jgi:hypothetical protein
VVSNTDIEIKKIPINKSMDKLDAMYDIDELDAIYDDEASVHSDKSRFYDPEGATERGVHHQDVNWPVKKVCNLKIYDRTRAKYLIQFEDNSKELVNNCILFHNIIFLFKMDFTKYVQLYRIDKTI